METNANLLDIVVKRDGVYLYIENKTGNPKVTRREVLALIESYGVNDVDYMGLNEALKNDFTQLEIKISDNTAINQTNESAIVEISRDRMNAFITFTPPVNNGTLMTPEELQTVITTAGVVNVEPETLEKLLKEKKYGEKALIATGKSPINGTNGYLQYHFDNSHLKPKPQIMEDGSVNFRQLGLFRLCNKGDLLVTMIPPTVGEDGMDVCGKPIPPRKGKPSIPLPKGKNTFVSSDGQNLLADVSGQLLIESGKIHVSPCLEIKGNVDNSTGDIDFIGEVTIRGNVMSGFTVKATDNIEVMGVCEAATLISGANIVLGNGAQGSDRAELTAEGDITAKFIESCYVKAKGNITSDSILKSVVACGGDVILSGKNGLLAGGSVIAGNLISAKTIGSPMGAATIIEVGNSPQILAQHREAVAEFNTLKTDLEKVELVVNRLTTLQQKGQLDEDKKAILLKMINSKMTFRKKLHDLQIKIDELVESMTANKGKVSASSRIRPGVKVTIGNAQLTIRDEIQNCTLRNNNAKITIEPCV